MNKRSIFLLLVSFYILLNNSLQAQYLGLDTVLVFGNQSLEQISCFTIDNEGNSYFAGSYSDSLTISSETLNGEGNRDIFIAKFDNEDKFQWAKSIGGKYSDQAYSIACDNSNNIYLSGSFEKEIELDGQINESQGLSDCFIVKLDALGNISSPHIINNKGAAKINILQTDSSGNLFVAGTFKKTIVFDTENELISNGKTDIYIVKYNKEGELVEQYQYGGEYNEAINSFKIDLNNNIFIGGSFEEDFSINSETVYSAGKSDAFIAKLNSNAEAIWLKSFGGNYNDKIKRIYLQDSSYVYMAGEYIISANIEDSLFNTERLQDVFIVKYNSETGEFIFANKLGGKSKNTVTNIIASDSLGIYISGTFQGQIDFNNDQVKSKGRSKDAYIARFNTLGRLDWVKQAKGNREEKLDIYFTNDKQRLLATGYFGKDFELVEHKVDSKHYKDVFFGKLIDCDLTDTVNLGKDTIFCQLSMLEVEGEFTSLLWNNGADTNQIQIVESGEYSIIAKDRYSCISYDTINIQVIGLPEIDLGKDTTYCSGNEYIIEVENTFESYLWNDDSNVSSRSISESGEYILEVTDENSCSNTDTVLVTVNPLPIVYLGDDKTGNSSTTVLLSTDELNYVEYLWSDSSITNTLFVDFAFIEDQLELSLTVLDTNNCTNSDSILLTKVNPPPPSQLQQDNEPENTIVEKEDEEKEIISEETTTDDLIKKITEYSIYPNPTSGRFYINIPLPELVKQVEIFNSNGMLIKSFKQIETNILEVDLTNHTKGLYLIYIDAGDTSNEFKVIYQ